MAPKKRQLDHVVVTKLAEDMDHNPIEMKIYLTVGSYNYFRILEDGKTRIVYHNEGFTIKENLKELLGF